MLNKVWRPSPSSAKGAMTTLGVVLVVTLVVAETYIIMQSPHVFTGALLTP